MNYSWILDNQINLKQPSHSIEDQNVARFEEFKTLANFEFFSLHSPSPTNYETRSGKIKLCKNDYRGNEGESTTNFKYFHHFIQFSNCIPVPFLQQLPIPIG